MSHTSEVGKGTRSIGMYLKEEQIVPMPYYLYFSWSGLILSKCEDQMTHHMTTLLPDDFAHRVDSS